MRSIRHETSRLVPGLAILVALLFSPSALAQTSQNVTLLSTQNLHSEYTGSWPYIHTDGREYVALGTRLGTAIVRLTDPANPVEVAFIPGANDGVREMEQYQTYLYVVATGSNPAGIQVISMADPDNPVLVNTVMTTTEAENVTIDTARGYLYTTESEPATVQRGIHVYSLADPVNPVRIAVYEQFDVHDITVKGTRGYACDQELNQVHILDLTNPATPSEIVSFTTVFGLTHTAWPTADDRYLVVSDENFGDPIGRPLIYDIQNLSQITLVYSFDDLLQAMPHFPMIRGNLVFVAHYTAGVHVYDIADPLWPVKVAFYDTWAGDDLIFAGVYEAPPFYPSGIFTATDRLTGLYVFQLGTAYGLVRGTVRAGNKPLAGAVVRALPDGPSFVTGADGRYGIAPSSTAGVTLECSKFGYLTQTATIAVATGSQQTQNFTLAGAATGTLKGTVRRASDMSVLAGADVTLQPSPLATTTSGMGKYTMMKVPIGSYTARAEVLDLAPGFAPISLLSHSTVTTDFTLQAAPFFDDAETDRGWTIGEPDDDAIAGRWIRAVPIGTGFAQFPTQPFEDHTPAPGTVCFVTGNAPAGSPINQESLRGGKTTLTSPTLDLSAVADPRVSYWLWFSNTHTIAAPHSSTVTTLISNDGGLSWETVSTFHAARTPWTRIEFRVLDHLPSAGSTVRVRFVAQNRIAGTVEVALDDFKCFSGVQPPVRIGDLMAAAPVSSVGPGLSVRSLRSSPMRGTASWSIRGSRGAEARVDLFDVQGRLVRSLWRGSLDAGSREVVWDGRSREGVTAGSGVYWLRVQSGSEQEIQKVVITR